MEYEKCEVRSDKHDEKTCDGGEVHMAFSNKVTDNLDLAGGNLTTAGWPKVIPSVRGRTGVGADTGRIDSLDSIVDNFVLNFRKASSTWGVRQG